MDIVNIEYLETFVLQNNKNWRYIHKGYVFFLCEVSWVKQNISVLDGFKSYGFTHVRLDLEEFPIDYNIISDFTRRKTMSFIKYITPNDIKERYDLKLSIEVKGKRISHFYKRMDSPKIGFYKIDEEPWGANYYTD